MNQKFRNRKIITIGNSFAVVIPKHLCRLLQLDRTTEVGLSLQDESIVVRAINRADRTQQPDRFRIGKLLAILIKRYQMKVPDFDRLSHDGTSLRAFLADVDIGGHLDLVTVARLDGCLGRRRELERAKIVESWAETVDTILLQVPNLPTATEPTPTTNPATNGG